MHDFGTVIGRIITGCKKQKFNMFAIDFDKTLITIHTGIYIVACLRQHDIWFICSFIENDYRGSALQLSKDVRPFLKDLIEQLVLNEIMVSIVTFSRQTALIRELLDILYAQDISSKIFIRGCDLDGKGLYGSMEWFSYICVSKILQCILYMCIIILRR